MRYNISVESQSKDTTRVSNCVPFLSIGIHMLSFLKGLAMQIETMISPSRLSRENRLLHGNWLGVCPVQKFRPICLHN